MGISDVYSKKPYAPSQDLLEQQNRAASSLPGFYQQGLALKEAQEQQARANRPVTPWQRAIMRLMAGDDPARVAAETKLELGEGGSVGGQGAPSGMPSGAPNSPQGGLSSVGAAPGVVSGLAGGILARGGLPSGMASQVPSHVNQGQPVYGPAQQSNMPAVGISHGADAEAMFAQPNRRPLNASAAFAMERNAPPQAQPSMSTQPAAPQWRGRGGMTEATFDGMTGRDYNDFVSGMHNANAAKQHRDYMAEIALRNQGQLDNTKEANKGKKEVAQLRLSGDVMKQDREDIRSELDRRIKLGTLDETKAHHAASIKLGYARLRELRQKYRMAHGQKEKLEMAKMLLQHSASLKRDAAQFNSTLSGLSSLGNEDLKQWADGVESEAEETKKLADTLLEQLQGEQPEVPISEGESVSKPIGATPENPTGKVTPKAAPKAAAPKTAGRTYKHKTSGKTITATEQQYKDAVGRGLINPAEWE